MSGNFDSLEFYFPKLQFNLFNIEEYEERIINNIFTRARYGSSLIIKLVLNNPKLINKTNSHLSTLLLEVAYAGNIHLANILLDNGADINAQNMFGMNALMLTQSLALTSLLLDRGININAKEMHGNNVLMIKAREDKFDACKLYLKKGIDLMLSDDFGNTALTDYGKFVHPPLSNVDFIQKHNILLLLRQNYLNFERRNSFLMALAYSGVLVNSNNYIINDERKSKVINVFVIMFGYKEIKIYFLNILLYILLINESRKLATYKIVNL
jgi:ankyrin repeat protein